jgi:hypothetical protein
MRKGFTRHPKSDAPGIRVKNYITPGGLQRLKDEHRFLLTRERPAVTQVVAWAAGNGDRSDNADYQYGKRRLREIDRRMNLRVLLKLVLILFAAFSEAHAQATAQGGDEVAFRAIYKELIAINTTRSVGNCTEAAEAMRRHLLAGGNAAEDMQILAPPEAPDDGALIAPLRGRDRSVKPILLLAHIDVVEATREDWTRARCVLRPYDTSPRF